MHIPLIYCNDFKTLFLFSKYIIELIVLVKVVDYSPSYIIHNLQTADYVYNCGKSIFLYLKSLLLDLIYRGRKPH